VLGNFADVSIVLVKPGFQPPHIGLASVVVVRLTLPKFSRAYQRFLTQSRGRSFSSKVSTSAQLLPIFFNPNIEHCSHSKLPYALPPHLAGHTEEIALVMSLAFARLRLPACLHEGIRMQGRTTLHVWQRPPHHDLNLLEFTFRCMSQRVFHYVVRHQHTTVSSAAAR
jgi:hypothetical protein